MAAPTRVQSVLFAFAKTAGTTQTCTSFNVQAGDVLTCRGMSEAFNRTLTVSDNSGGALTWTLQQSDVTSNHVAAYLWTATVPSNITGLTVTITVSLAAVARGFRVTTWRGSGGVGVSNKAVGATAPSTTLTGVSANSAIDAECGDWNAGAASGTWGGSATPTSETAALVSGAATFYQAYYADTGTAGNKIVSMASIPGGGISTIMAVEILGGVSGAALSGFASASGACSGSLAAAPVLSGSSDAAGVTAGTLAVTQQISGSSSGIGTMTGALKAVSQLSGSSAGAGTVSGVLAVAQQLSGLAAATSSTTGALNAAPLLSGSSSGAGTMAGTLKAIAALSGSSNSAGAASGSLTTPGASALSGMANGTGSTSGSLSVTSQLSGSSSGVGSITGLLCVTSIITGSAGASGSSSGSLSARRLISGSSNGAGAVVGLLRTIAQLSGVASGSGSTSGTIATSVIVIPVFEPTLMTLDGRDPCAMMLDAFATMLPFDAHATTIALGPRDPVGMALDARDPSLMAIDGVPSQAMALDPMTTSLPFGEHRTTNTFDERRTEMDLDA